MKKILVENELKHKITDTKNKLRISKYDNKFVDVLDFVTKIETIVDNDENYAYMEYVWTLNNLKLQLISNGCIHSSDKNVIFLINGQVQINYHFYDVQLVKFLIHVISTFSI